MAGRRVRVRVRVRELLPWPQGYYNIDLDAISSVRDATDRKPTADAAHPLSVQGQVQRLIQQATSDENLSRMYIGWMPFL